MSWITTRDPTDIERLTIAATGTNRGIMFSELGDEIGRILPTTGDLLATEEFTLTAGSLPDLLAEFLYTVTEGIKEGIVHTLWQCTFAFSTPPNQHKLYVLAHTEEIESLVELDMIATKWFKVEHAETAEIILRVPSILS
jgi:hypothetical protein